jgi:hypothetical protein
MADRMVFNKTDTIGGGAGAVDNITAANRGDTNPLQTDDRCFVMKSDLLSAYRYDSTSSAVESDPDVIRPDDVIVTDPGRWILQGVVASISDASITNAKLAHIATSIIKGRVAAGSGDVEDLSAANVRTIINVADGANAYTHPNHSGDVTSAADGAQTIAAKAVHVSMLADGTDGELITWGADGVATVIAAGDDSHVLTSHGAGAVPTWEAAGAAFDPTAPGTIGGTTPGVVYGLNKEIYKTADADSPLTAVQCAGTIVSNYGMTDADCTIDLPTAAEGLAFICILPTVQAHFFRLKCPTAQTDKINLLTAGAWVAGSDDGYVGVASGYSANASISMFCAKIIDGTYEWFAMPVAGTWVAG